MHFIKTTLFFSVFILLTSCVSDNKKDIVGTWESFEDVHPKNEITFYQDSIVSNPFGFESGTTSESWAVDATKIFLKNSKKDDSLIKKKLEYEYKLNAAKDTLLIKIVKGSKDDFSLLKRVK